MKAKRKVAPAKGSQQKRKASKRAAAPRAPTLLVAVLLKPHGETSRVYLSRHGEKGKWHLPDSDVAFGQDIHAAMREAFYSDFDSRIVVGPVRPWHVIETFPSAPGRKHYVTLCVEGSFLASLPVHCADGVQPAKGKPAGRWFSVAEALGRSDVSIATVEALNRAVFLKLVTQ